MVDIFLRMRSPPTRPADGALLTKRRELSPISIGNRTDEFSDVSWIVSGGLPLNVSFASTSQTVQAQPHGALGLAMSNARRTLPVSTNSAFLNSAETIGCRATAVCPSPEWQDVSSYFIRDSLPPRESLWLASSLICIDRLNPPLKANSTESARKRPWRHPRPSCSLT